MDANDYQMRCLDTSKRCLDTSKYIGKKQMFLACSLGAASETGELAGKLESLWTSAYQRRCT